MVGKHPVEECDPVFANLENRGLLTEAHYTERFRLAIDARQFRLARYLSRPLPPEYREETTTWLRALQDPQWASQTRQRLTTDATRLDNLFQGAGAQLLGGTTLFRLFEISDAAEWQSRLARHQIWSRVFPYNPRWLRHRYHQFWRRSR